MVATLIHTGQTDRQADGGAEERMNKQHAIISGEERFYGNLMSSAKVNVFTCSCNVSDSFVRF